MPPYALKDGNGNATREQTTPTRTTAGTRHLKVAEHYADGSRITEVRSSAELEYRALGRVGDNLYTSNVSLSVLEVTETLSVYTDASACGFKLQG